MRYILILSALLLTVAPALAAEPHTSRGIVMAYECEQVDPAITGFSCQFKDGHLRLQWHKNPVNMQNTVNHLDFVAGQANDALDIILSRIGIFEYSHIAALGITAPDPP